MFDLFCSDCCLFKSGTIRCQQLCHDLNMYDWLGNLFDCLLIQPVTIQIGFSFLTKHPLTETMDYMYAAPELSCERARVSTEVNVLSNDWFLHHLKEQLDNFREQFKNKSSRYFLENTFLSANDEGPFQKSGIIPHKLVCAYCWITKWFIKRRIKGSVSQFCGTCR